MSKKFLTLFSAILMVFAAVANNAQTDGDGYDCFCNCGAQKGFQYVESGNDIFLGCTAPEFVVFRVLRDSQMPDNHVAVWIPENSTLTWDEVQAAVATEEAPDWWDDIAASEFFTETFECGDHAYWVEQCVETGWWYASTTANKIGNISWFAKECVCDGCTHWSEPDNDGKEVEEDLLDWEDSDFVEMLLAEIAAGNYILGAGGELLVFMPDGRVVSVNLSDLLNVAPEVACSLLAGNPSGIDGTFGPAPSPSIAGIGGAETAFQGIMPAAGTMPTPQNVVLSQPVSDRVEIKIQWDQGASSLWAYYGSRDYRIWIYETASVAGNPIKTDPSTGIQYYDINGNGRNDDYFSDSGFIGTIKTVSSTYALASTSSGGTTTLKANTQYTIYIQEEGYYLGPGMGYSAFSALTPVKTITTHAPVCNVRACLH